MKSEFIKLYESLNFLNESKQDTANFENFFIKNGSSVLTAKRWVDRFNAIKHKLKSPKNDYYYWMKQDIDDLCEVIEKLEQEIENRDFDLAEAESGAEFVGENAIYRVYWISTYAASKKYGANTKWCLSGSNIDGLNSWNDYAQKMALVYFYLPKSGMADKYQKHAVVVYPNDDIEIFNELDIPVTGIPNAPIIGEIPAFETDPAKIISCFDDPELDDFIDELNYFAESTSLQEAKQDTLNFKNWLIDKGASEVEADEYTKRFDKIKQFLKAPETDYYYWIKNKKPQDLYDVVNDTERVIEVKRTKKAEIADGAELINETEHWKIYHITNFEASQYYGRDSKWCITGVGSYGDRYWRDYTRRGYEFYFIIAKEDYDPRGSESKFAFAMLKNVEYYQIFDQQDSETKLEDIPYYEEIKIPGINLDYYTNGEPFFCDDCGDALSGDGDDTYCSPDGYYCYCSKCWDEHYFYCQNCGEAFSWDDAYTGADDYSYCYNCWCEFFTECYNCGDIIEQGEAREGTDYNYYCESCWEESFFICQECDEVYRKDDDLVEADGGEFCDGCYRAIYGEDEE